MEYPNLPERKLIDIPANSRASRGTCKIITTRWSQTKPSKLAIDGSTRKTCPIRAYNSTTPLKMRAERCREHKQLRKRMQGAQRATLWIFYLFIPVISTPMLALTNDPTMLFAGICKMIPLYWQMIPLCCYTWEHCNKIKTTINSGQIKKKEQFICTAKKDRVKS